MTYQHAMLTQLVEEGTLKDDILGQQGRRPLSESVQETTADGPKQTPNQKLQHPTGALGLGPRESADPRSSANYLPVTSARRGSQMLPIPAAGGAFPSLPTSCGPGTGQIGSFTGVTTK